MFPTFAMTDSLQRLQRRRAKAVGQARPSPAAAAEPRPLDSDSDEEMGYGLPSHAVDVLQLMAKSWFGEPFKGRRSAARLASSASSSPLLKPRAPHAPSPFVEQPKAAAGAAPEPAMQQAAAHNIVASSGAVRAPPPSVPVPTSAPQVPQEALAVQQLPGIGTWAGRQRLFSRPADLRNVPRSPSSGSPAPLTSLGSAADAGAGPAVLRPAPAARVARGGGLLSPASSSGTEQEAREAAWRWRFSRKWEAEQKKYYEGGGEAGAPMNGSLVSNDDLEAIQYTQACGVGVNLQFNPTTTPTLHRTPSRASDSTLYHSLSCQFDVSGHGGSMALGALSAAASWAEQQTPLAAAAAQQQQASGGAPPRPSRRAAGGGGAPWLSPGGEAPQPSATSKVLSMASKAQELLEKQQEIEREVQSRWERSMNGGSEAPWAGQKLRAVHISMSGRFRFVLLRALDGSGHQRYLIRGHSRATPAELAEEAVQEAVALCKREGLPQLILEQVGAGVMEWREDTDRHLHISATLTSGDSISQGPGGAAGGSLSPTKRGGGPLGDITGLAASLVRQVLPCHFQVTASSAPNRMASLMDTLRI